jgi:uncharacterized protein YwqG
MIDREEKAKLLSKAEDLSGLFDLYELKEFEDTLMEQALPSLLLRLSATESGEPAVGCSKMGGLPDLAEGSDWPTTANKIPLAFLCQINLAEIADTSVANSIGSSGLLSFFYEANEQPWGFEPGTSDKWKVIFTGDSETLVRLKAPTDLPDGCLFDCLLIGFNERLTFPSYENPFPGLTWPQNGDYHDMQQAWYGSYCPERLLGYPNLLQNDWRLQCALASQGVYCGDNEAFDAMDQAAKDAFLAESKEWRLLLQLDSFNDSGMDWGMGGLLHFCITEQALRAKDFDHVWVILQTT